MNSNVDPSKQQILQQHALEIALKYQDQERWKTAAENLRAPYWDWATNTVPPPEVVTLEIVKITTPDGEEAVPNPLIKYAFHPIDPSFPSEPSPYNSWPTTIRHPTPPDSPDATSDVQALIEYGFTLPIPSCSHSFFFTKANWLPFRSPSPRVPTTF